MLLHIKNMEDKGIPFIGSMVNRKLQILSILFNQFLTQAMEGQVTWIFNFLD